MKKEERKREGRRKRREGKRKEKNWEKMEIMSLLHQKKLERRFGPGSYSSTRYFFLDFLLFFFYIVIFLFLIVLYIY